MEWTKENTRNSFIRFNTTKQKEKAIKFYKDLGYTETGPMKVYPNYKGQEVGTVCVEWNTMIFVSRTWTPAGDKIKINPFYKPRRKFAREMMVSDDEIEWFERTIFGIVKSDRPYVAKLNLKQDKSYLYGAWKYAKEID